MFDVIVQWSKMTGNADKNEERLRADFEAKFAQVRAEFGQSYGLTLGKVWADFGQSSG